jgi:AraC family transcriptional regulator of adaptative response/methylated-DNA-[protein]-cysteine methyltransferase
VHSYVNYLATNGWKYLLIEVKSIQYHQSFSQDKTVSMPSEQEMQKAIVSRDKSFDGDFFYGVITTGVFCRPSCSSRSAKPENLRFFPNHNTAMVKGFRPCKRCQPIEAKQSDDRMVNIARYIEEHADETLTLASLANIAKLSSSRLQRIFKEAFGISPKTYQEALRMRRFKADLKKGATVTDAIYSSGFGSTSRIYGETSRNIGMTPKPYQKGAAGEIVSYACRNTILGLMAMAATDKGVCFVEFGVDEQSLISKLKIEFPNAMLVASSTQNSEELNIWIEALNQHISERAPRPDLPLDMRGTVFQMKVWQFLLSIKEGDVLSYSTLATKIDNPKAFRAVASACAANRIGILIPCHRVLRGDGSLGGYRWGLERKQSLLEAEKK